MKHKINNKEKWLRNNDLCKQWRKIKETSKDLKMRKKMKNNKKQQCKTNTQVYLMNLKNKENKKSKREKTKLKEL